MNPIRRWLENRRLRREWDDELWSWAWTVALDGMPNDCAMFNAFHDAFEWDIQESKAAHVKAQQKARKNRWP